MTTLIIAAVAAVIIIAIVVAWFLTANKAKAAYQVELSKKEAELHTSEALRCSETEQHKAAMEELKAIHEKALADVKESQEKAIEAARNALALENEKALKAREESLKKEAAEAMKNATGGLDQRFKDMKDALDRVNKSQVEESATLKTKVEEAVKSLREQTEAVGNQAEDLAKALKGQNKLQGNFGETILENMLQEQGLREGKDYESEYWLRDPSGNIIRNEETGRKMRPDFVLHFPNDTDILIDSKMSLTALTDYFAADTDEAREEAALRNLESVRNHVKELNSKDYQKYVKGRKTLDFVIMFIPNYGALQLAKMKDPGVFNWAFEQNVLITTEETLIPFLRMIRSAWVNKEQLDNIGEIISAAEDMVERVGIFCRDNAAVGEKLRGAVKDFEENSRRLVDGQQSIVKAARKAIQHGIKAPGGKNTLPPLDPIE